MERVFVISRAMLMISLLPCTSGCERRQPRAASSVVLVAAAADLTAAFEELGREHGKDTGQQVTFSFGSTGLLAKQLREGAPYDLFAAANASFVDEVVAAGACDGATMAPYARGRIAIWTKRRPSFLPPTSLEDLTHARFGRVAIANPEHAPYGQAARQALQEAGLWSTLQPRLVYGENVRQTLQFAETGNVDAAIVALALVARDLDNPWLLIDEERHQPIDQVLVVCDGGANRAGGQAFAQYVVSERGRDVMRRFGFSLPTEAAPTP